MTTTRDTETDIELLEDDLPVPDPGRTEVEEFGFYKQAVLTPSDITLEGVCVPQAPDPQMIPMITLDEKSAHELKEILEVWLEDWA